MRTRTYKNQFGPEYAPPVDLLNALMGNDWVDVSDGGSICPMWERVDEESGEGFIIFSDAENASDREMPGNPRYFIGHIDDFDRIGGTIYSGDDLSYVLDWIGNLHE